MAVQFTVNGWEKWLELFVRQAASVHLYTAGDRADNLQELVDAKYGSFALVAARWKLSHHETVVAAVYPEQMWRFAQPQKVLGHYVVGKEGGVLWWEQFALARNLDAPLQIPLVQIQALELVVELDLRG